ncbi:MAG: hypothetical protein JWQ26_645 [Modestobacter sp.]|nr:hypothetical protein [Modestobacter sp.]
MLTVGAPTTGRPQRCERRRRCRARSRGPTHGSGTGPCYYDFGGSLAGVGRLFAEADVPLASLTGPANVLFELVGGIAMILGAAVPVIGVLMALNMAGAWTFVHTSGLFAMDHNGPELVIALGLLSLILAVTGSGRFGLDHLIVRRLRRTSQTTP